MLLKCTHETDLTYSDLISESVMELRMAPRQEHDQRRLSFGLAVGPPTAVMSYFDWLGNAVHAFTINPFHREIRIRAISVVETRPPSATLEGLPDRWPIANPASDYRLYDFLQLGGPIVDCAELRQIAENLDARQGMGLGELAGRMLAMVNDQFTYRKGVTTAASPITEMLQQRGGVCQDFAHLMIGLCRAMGIPARYVSGLVHPEGQRYRGFAQTHAWFEMLCPSAGWLGLDAANNCAVDEHFIKVAIGRDFRDVPPNKGMWKGAAQESISVAVHSELLASVPPELAGERIDSIAVPVYSGDSPAHAQWAARQQEHQQQ